MLRPFDLYRWQDHIASPSRSDLLVSVLFSSVLAVIAICELPGGRPGPDAALALDNHGSRKPAVAGHSVSLSSPFTDVGTTPRQSRSATVADPVLGRGQLFDGCNGA